MDLTGAEVSRLFWQEAVAPLLARQFPRLRYAAGRLGSGSDVLGLDDGISRDHDWGCRLTLLVDAADRAAVSQVRELLEGELPASYRGLPVRFGTTWDPAVAHRVEVATAGDFARSRLGADPLRGLSVVDWLVLTGQGVLEVTAGPVFADQTRDLGRVREMVRWYPPDIERYVLAAGWWQIKARMPNHTRAAQRGDDLGSRLIAAAIAADLARLAFLVHRRWAPYSNGIARTGTSTRPSRRPWPPASPILRWPGCRRMWGRLSSGWITWNCSTGPNGAPRWRLATGPG